MFLKIVTLAEGVSVGLFLAVYRAVSQREGEREFGWLVVFGFNGPLRQYFSLYQGVFQREGECGEKW